MLSAVARAQYYSFLNLDDPAADNFTVAYGISGGNIVGEYSDSDGGVHGFLYNEGTGNLHPAQRSQ
jgi:hypothetical protein